MCRCSNSLRKLNKKLKNEKKSSLTLFASFACEAWRACAHVIGLDFRQCDDLLLIQADRMLPQGAERAVAAMDAHAAAHRCVLLVGTTRSAVVARHRCAWILDDFTSCARQARHASAFELIAASMMTRSTVQTRLVSSTVI
jgi:hypothetical protein